LPLNLAYGFAASMISIASFNTPTATTSLRT
jgi:hypothetical protein